MLTFYSCYIVASYLCNLNILLSCHSLPRMRELSFQFLSPIHCSVILLFHAVIPSCPMNTSVFITESSISHKLSLPCLQSQHNPLCDRKAKELYFCFGHILIMVVVRQWPVAPFLTVLNPGEYTARSGQTRDYSKQN